MENRPGPARILTESDIDSEEDKDNQESFVDKVKDTGTTMSDILKNTAVAVSLNLLKDKVIIKTGETEESESDKSISEIDSDSNNGDESSNNGDEESLDNSQKEDKSDDDTISDSS